MMIMMMIKKGWTQILYVMTNFGKKLIKIHQVDLLLQLFNA